MLVGRIGVACGCGVPVGKGLVRVESVVHEARKIIEMKKWMYFQKNISITKILL